jgi:DNA-binding transcriptional LysR family regulator
MPDNGRVWSDLRLFLEVARCRSFSKAAPRVGATHPTLARAVRRLEKTLGIELLTASELGVELTREGKRLADKLAPVERAILSLLNSVRT